MGSIPRVLITCISPWIKASIKDLKVMQSRGQSSVFCPVDFYCKYINVQMIFDTEMKMIHESDIWQK